MLHGFQLRFSPATGILTALLAFGVEPSGLSAQEAAIASDLPREGFIERTRSIHLRSGVASEEGGHRLVVFIDATDVTAILERSADGWRYDATLLPLPSGDHELVAWLVEADSIWQEVLREPFRVPGVLSIESASARPTLDLGMKSRLASGFEPAVPGERDSFNDFDGRVSLDAEVERHGGTRFTSRVQFVGDSEAERALRFRQLADEAPRIDLASYLTQVQHGGLGLALGNVVAGDARHLIQGFNSRGASLSLEAGPRMQLAASALHGSSLVGWDDLLGFDQPDHRLLTGSIALQLLSRPGALAVDLTLLDGSVLPRSGFDTGAITDAETSRGYAIRVQSQALDRRLRLESGFTRSSFDNPEDPSLAGDTALVDVARETRDARYLQASLDVLRGIALGGSRTARLTVGWAHERVDPLFRTVASYTRADQLQNRWELRADVAGVTVSADHTRSRNNLDDIASILTSQTRRSGLDVAVPLPSLIRTAAWLPSLRWRAGRTHQFGTGVPAGGGFDPTHVPDQVSTDHTIGADVRFGFASLGYRFDLAKQDNRQVGRETADLERTGHGVTVSITPLRTLNLNLDLSQADARNLERAETESTRRVGVGIDWSPVAEAVLGVQLSDTRGENDVRLTARNDRTVSVQWTSPVPGLRRFGAKWLLRFARAENTARDATGLDVRLENWTVDAGFNLSFR